MLKLLLILKRFYFEERRSLLVRDVLGDHLYNRYLAIKTEEWNEFKQQVTRWEIERYFDI